MKVPALPATMARAERQGVTSTACWGGSAGGSAGGSMDDVMSARSPLIIRARGTSGSAEDERVAGPACGVDPYRLGVEELVDCVSAVLAAPPAGPTAPEGHVGRDRAIAVDPHCPGLQPGGD